MSKASKARQTARGGRFWRYSYRVLAGTGYWILAVPVAASQVVTLWMMALASDFSQLAATRIAELLMPVLGAFLTAHSLAPEYRSSVGAILACKPLSLNRVLGMRVGLSMLGAFLLTFVTLAVCSVGLKPIELWPPLLAALPALWFLSTLALVFATVFRSPLGGFAVAMGLWGLDLALGYGAHPLLSSQGLSAELDADPLSPLWPYGKAAQVVAGAALWWLHPRLLPRICRPPERMEVQRIAGVCAVMAGVYCLSGAGTMVAFAYARRGSLPQPDPVWLRRQLRTYGPVPVASLFGPAFAAYVSEPPAAKAGPAQTSVRLEQLERALARWPRSLWADGIAYSLASEGSSLDPQAAVPRYFAVADRFSASPFASKALAAILRADEGVSTDDERLRAARRLLAHYPRTRDAQSAAEALADYYPARVPTEEFLAALRIAEASSPPYRRPEWLVRRAELEAGMGRPGEALQTVRQAREEAQRLQAAARDASNPNALELTPHVGSMASVIARAEKLTAELQKGR